MVQTIEDCINIISKCKVFFSVDLHPLTYHTPSHSFLHTIRTAEPDRNSNTSILTEHGECDVCSLCVPARIIGFPPRPARARAAVVTAISRHRDGPAGTADLLTLTPTGEGDGGHGRVAPSDGTGDVSGGPLVQRFPAIARDHRGGGGGGGLTTEGTGYVCTSSSE